METWQANKRRSRQKRDVAGYVLQRGGDGTSLEVYKTKALAKLQSYKVTIKH